MQTDTSPNQHVFIHRHCMQQLIHKAITSNQKQCFGWLTGSGNIITNSIHVTDKLFPCNTSTPTAHQKEVVSGAYFVTDKRNNVAQKKLTEMNLIMVENGLPALQYYLILYLDHNGRIDAHMSADSALQSPVILNMKEA